MPRDPDDDYYSEGVDGYDDSYEGEMDFADPDGKSALRASSANNPRNLPCPNCKRSNMLTPADVARHYQCDICADAAEGGGY